jgi:hypothetical protein
MNPKTPKNPEPFDIAQGKLATPKPEKLPYEPPQAVFVPLKLEERLLSCYKIPPPIDCDAHYAS